jgi:hypothetical protein
MTVVVAVTVTVTVVVAVGMLIDGCVMEGNWLIIGDTCTRGSQ